MSLQSQVLTNDAVDAVIVGSGLSGIFVAEQLAAHGLSTLILEAGSILTRDIHSCNLNHFREITEPFTQIDEEAWGYRTDGSPYDWIRVRAGGGRSLIWGGWALRPHAQNFRDARAFNRPWPISLEDFDRQFHRVELLLNVTEGVIDPSFKVITKKLGLEVQPKRAAISPCGCCPYVSLDRLSQARIHPNAVALHILFDRKKRTIGVEYIDTLTRQVDVVRANVTILSASPIETTRLLLMSLPNGHHDTQSLIGRGFTDHNVLSYLVIHQKPAPLKKEIQPFENAAFIPRFVNLGRTKRRDYQGGFTLELHGPDSVSLLAPDTLNALGIDTHLAPELSYHLVHAIGEIPPNPDNRITLHPKEQDVFGRPLPVVRLIPSLEQAFMDRDMEETAIAVCDSLGTEGSRIIPLHSLDSQHRTRVTSHEAGTCPIGVSPRTSVVDLSGRVRGVSGLYIADASLLPTALDRPPTLTILTLALNTADSIIEAPYSC